MYEEISNNGRTHRVHGGCKRPKRTASGSKKRYASRGRSKPRRSNGVSCNRRKQSQVIHLDKNTAQQLVEYLKQSFKL